MSTLFDTLMTGLADPATLFGHFTYLLLIVSMLMRKMVWLRTLAVASGLAKIVYRAVFVLDPVSVVWETIFVLVNLGQLLAIWYFERYNRFTEDESQFAASLPFTVERRAIKRALKLASLRVIPVGERLTAEGHKVDELFYIAAGVATIEKAGRIIAACGPGDYLGEMSFLSGETASATAVCARPMRALVFNQLKLKAAMKADPMIRRVMEAGLNQNLVGKLVRANGGPTSA